jgi:hypothetical protein
MVYCDVNVALIENRIVYNVTESFHSLESFCAYSVDNVDFGEVTSALERER